MRGRSAGGRIVLPPGTLRRTLRRRTAYALAAGAFEPIPTRAHRIDDGGIPFLVREAALAERKTRARAVQDRTGANPFLPYDEDLFVADLSPTHLCLLNRFFVLEHHLLIVTREFAEQESPLDRRDFTALAACMAEIDGLGFYNSGPAAGASQRHKHLQLVAAPLGDGPERAPLERILAAARFEGAVGRLSALPFPHALTRLDPEAFRSPAAGGAAALAAYRRLSAAAGGEGGAEPYNLLLTRDWMLRVPRRRAAYRAIEVNALGFAGALLVRDAEQLELLRRLGPLNLLARVARPPAA